MRKNLNKLAKIVFSISIALLLANCDRNEPIGQNNLSPTIANTKSWFEDYKSNVTFDPLYKNLEYHWEKASVRVLYDNTSFIVVPIDNLGQDKDYKREMVLYFFPKKDLDGFSITLFETIPDKKYHIDNNGLINLDTFEGFMIESNLETGFEQGASFKNGLPIEQIVKTTKQNNKIDNKETSKMNTDVPILLNTVTVPAYQATQMAYLFIVNYGYGNRYSYESALEFLRQNSYLIPYHYIPPYSGSSSQTNTNSIKTLSVTTFFTPNITDVKKELKCFDQSSGAKLTIYADQSVNGSRQLTANIGHTFIGITQNDVTRNVGFYPESPNASLLSSQTSQIHDNSTSTYDVSITIDISATQLKSIVSYIENYPKSYDLNKFNCTDFGIQVMSLGGLALPKTEGSWGILFKGHNPNDLGEDMRKLSLPQGATRDLKTGKAPVKTGSCN
jgi:hypothetical protein